jgi:hypothetical protein
MARLFEGRKLSVSVYLKGGGNADKKERKWEPWVDHITKVPFLSTDYPNQRRCIPHWEKAEPFWSLAISRPRPSLVQLILSVFHNMDELMLLVRRLQHFSFID